MPDDVRDTGWMSIGEVIARLTADHPDLSHSSLRFLERQGLISPHRTSGGHRLFCERDLERIRRIKTWQTQHLSLREIDERLRAADQLAQPADLSRRFLDLALAGDRAAAFALIAEAADLGLPLEQVFDQTLIPALEEVGRRWAAGELLVCQEKDVSSLVSDLIASLASRFAAPPVRPPAILAACVPGEYHELGLRMVVAVLQSRGYWAHYLGPNVDSQFLRDAVRLRDPTVVLLSATLEAHLDGLRSSVDAIRAERSSPSPRIAVGGRLALLRRDLLESWGLLVEPGSGVGSMAETVLSVLPTPVDQFATGGSGEAPNIG